MAIQITDSAAVELVDALVAASDANRTDEVTRLRSVLADIGLADEFDQEWRLSAVPTVPDGWSGEWL